MSRAVLAVALTLLPGAAAANESVPPASRSNGASTPPPDAPTATPTEAGPTFPALAPLHLSARAFFELQSRTFGAEVGASYGLGPYTDVGLSAMLGQRIGGRLLLALHPAPGWRVRPLLQLRGAFNPTPSGLALGAGAGLGASLELGPGRVTALAVGELYSGPPDHPPSGLFAMLGYELDPFASHASRTGGPTTDAARGEEPAVATVQPKPSGPKQEPLRMDDLPPPTYTEPLPDFSRQAPASGPRPAAPPPAGGGTRVTRRISIPERIHFGVGTSRIRSRYLPVLKQVANVLKRHPLIKKVRIDGYADDKGTDAASVRLSEHRARAVMDYLVKHGVDPSRLEIRANGHAGGARRSLEENRRVEFTVVDPPQDG